MYGGRVVPFVIRRTELAQGPNVQDIRSGSTDLRPSLPDDERPGRAGDQGQDVRRLPGAAARELRHPRPRANASRGSGASSKRTPAGSAAASAAWSRRSRRCCRRCPTSSSIPSVVAGHFPVEFLQLPEEVLTTTMIHHQHYFPVVDEEGRLKPAFLAVTNMQPEKPEIIARNSERVLAARLRDARFFWDEDRKATLESRIGALVDDPVPQEARQLSREGGARGGAGRAGSPRGVRAARRRRRTPSRPAGSARRTSPPTWCAS